MIPRTSFMMIVGLCCLGVIIVIFGIRFLAQVPELSQEQQLQNILRNLTETQRKEYLARQYALLATRQVNALTAAQRAPVWVIIWQCLTIGGIIVMLSAGTLWTVRKSQHYAETRMTDPEGMTLVTRIPIIAATKEERVLLASSQIARNLALAQGDSTALAVDMLKAVAQTAKSFQGFVPKSGQSTAISGTDPLSLPSDVPSRQTFAELIMSGEIGPGKPLILGASVTGPEYRSLESVKTMAVTGMQGSGKTLSIVYFIASCLLAYGQNILTYVLDPHYHTSESLGWYLQPLTQAKLVTMVPPAETAMMIQKLNQMVESRISGKAPCNQRILVVIDELGRLSKMSCFPTLIDFFDKAVQDTRKIGITTIGISHKWTARHFKGHADIRAAMNSMWIHKTKPSNAKLLMEDMDGGKRLLERIKEPGQGILVTDYSDPKVVTTPWMNPGQDLQTVIDLVRRPGDVPSTISSSLPNRTERQDEQKLLDADEIQSRLRAMVQDGRRVREIWENIFAESEMKFSTFQTKYKNPVKRPWTPEEQHRVSKWIQMKEASCVTN